MQDDEGQTSGAGQRPARIVRLPDGQVITGGGAGGGRYQGPLTASPVAWTTQLEAPQEWRMHLMAEQDAPTWTDLSDLVRTRRKELGLSYERLGQRAIDPETGTKVPGSWFHRLATGEKVQVPNLERLRAIAAAIDCALGPVQDAASAQFFGIDTSWSISGEARALVEQAGQLNPEQREQLRRFLETITRNTPS